MNLIAYCFQATDPIQALFVEKIRDYDNKKQTAGSRAGQAVLLLIYSSIAHSTMFWIYSLRDLNLVTNIFQYSTQHNVLDFQPP